MLKRSSENDTSMVAQHKSCGASRKKFDIEDATEVEAQRHGELYVPMKFKPKTKLCLRAEGTVF
jgi:hypothetical protein